MENSGSFDTLTDNIPVDMAQVGIENAAQEMSNFWVITHRSKLEAIARRDLA